MDVVEFSPEEFSPASLETTIVNVLAVRQAFKNLSDEHRDILALVDIGGFSYEEAANMLDIPIGTVMSRISRGRVALAGLLSDDNIVEMQSTRRRNKL